MDKCSLCPNNCHIDRKTAKGFCGVDDKIKVARVSPHYYEEPIISGDKGSGAVFFCGCSLKCVFCQNYEVSRNKVGKEITVEKLAEIFSELEEKGVHNINLVNPTHYADKIVNALKIYKPKIPVVWNSHGYESVETLKKVDEFIDVYLPDLKYFSGEVSKRYSGKENYFAVAKKAIEFMAEKPLEFQNGLIKKGTVVRHLVLPMNVEDTLKVIDFIAEIKDKIYFSLMSQYTPFGDIENFPELNRKITKREYEKVVNYALSCGIKNMFVQKLNSSDIKYIPDWDYE